MNSLTDQQLLRDYVERRSDTAFAELVRRHVDHVYSAALRMVCDAHLAKDVTQGAFVALAQNARQLTDRPILSGWLHLTTRNLAANTVRSEVRRRAREQEAAAMNQLLARESDATWENIGPHLDAALGDLNDAERDALTLRYFERKSAREMADVLGISEDAAQKRVNRAVESLREFLSKRRLTIGAAGLATLISANVVQSAPVGLAAAISTGALAGTAIQTSTLIATTKTVAMTTFSKSLIAAALAALAGTAIYAAHQNSKLRGQVQRLQQEQTPLTHEVQQLQQSYEDATNQLAGLQIQNAQLESNNSDLLASRNQVPLSANNANTTERKKTTTVAAPWKAWNNRQKIGSFYAVAGTATETVAVGIDGRIATRNNMNGVWNVQTFTGDPDFRAIIYADNQYVVVREKGSIMTSPNGLDWTRRDSPTKENLMGIFWDGRQYLAGGDGGTILASPDGIQWTVCNSGGNVSVYSFSYSGSRYIAVGNDGVFTSSDAITWTALTNAPNIPFTACTWTGNEFLACGLGLDRYPTIYISPDGDDWTLRDDTITASLRAAITVNGTVYVSGDSVIAKSTDGGTTWTNTFSNAGMNKLFMGLANDGDNLIAAGFNHNVWSLPLSEAQ